ncbi:TRAP transporter substrate-binding protein [Phreatobacter sp. AB_2022a]|uniref:TRAP transporter substrate-binding protein n=1 Tax=Phreatobacter sp. AB_2022a TaxID=3003134 RepID=UPI0022875456|nr:TRAP transporter substrate-binding protein [Phreatobacter sp. AB_2022a]MCZ0736389.1 TRAP transporter substrate-binding protein [Phreatobacter sp. AB_2022a]
MRRFMSAIVSLMLGAGGAPAVAQTLPPGPPLAIQMVTQLSPSIPQYTRVDIPMLREGIPQRSGGRISVTLASWPERNLSGPELLRVLRAGQIDLAGIALPTVAGDVPLLDIIDLAGLNASHDQARRVAEAMLPTLNQELERVGVRIVAFYPFPAQVLFCRDPVTSLADLKGRRVRTPGGSQNDFIQSIGAQPVAIGFPEVYAALERGVVDCAVTGTATGNGARWYEVTRHLYALPIQWGTAAYGVNLAWWNRLDPAVRQFLQETMRNVEEAQWKLGLEATEDGIQCNAGLAAGCRIGRVVESRPMTVTRASEADAALLRQSLSTVVLPAFVKRCGERCGEVYNRIVAPISGVRYEAR